LPHRARLSSIMFKLKNEGGEGMLECGIRAW
jgi:hypothetical protein